MNSGSNYFQTLICTLSILICANVIISGQCLKTAAPFCEISKFCLVQAVEAILVIPLSCSRDGALPHCLLACWIYSCSACTPLECENTVLAGCVSAACFFVHLLTFALTCVCALCKIPCGFRCYSSFLIQHDNLAFSL